MIRSRPSQSGETEESSSTGATCFFKFAFLFTEAASVHILYCYLFYMSWSFGAILEWRTVSDPKQASWLYSQDLLHRNKDSKSLFLSVDIRQDREEQDRAIITFYGRDDVQWTAPLKCTLKGSRWETGILASSKTARIHGFL